MTIISIGPKIGVEKTNINVSFGGVLEKRGVLESWKEISDYLHRSKRTCQRWEAQFGLPIHRLDDSLTGRVFAYADELDRWLAEKLEMAEVRRKKPILSRLKTKKWVIAASGIALFLVLAAFLIWRFLFPPPVSFPPITSPVVAFFPLDNITRDESLEAWKTALPQLLSLDLLQSQTIKVLYPPPYLMAEEIGLTTQTYFPEDLERIANKIMADYLITGSLLKSPAEIIIDLYLYDSETIGLTHTLRTVCPGEKEIFPAVEDLSKKIKAELNIPDQVIQHDIDENIARIATDSPEAWKLYCQGDTLFWERKYQESIPWLKKATEIDPDFGQAFFELYQANRHLPRV